jgi:hypothetical protein
MKNRKIEEIQDILSTEKYKMETMAEEEVIIQISIFT